MDLLGTRWVDPVRQSPRTRAYGFFAKGTVPTSLILAHLVFFLLPTVFASCLPRLLQPPVARSHGPDSLLTATRNQHSPLRVDAYGHHRFSSTPLPQLLLVGGSLEIVR